MKLFYDIYLHCITVQTMFTIVQQKSKKHRNQRSFHIAAKIIVKHLLCVLVNNKYK